MYHKVLINKLLFLVFVIGSENFSCERRASRAEIEHNFDICEQAFKEEIEILKARTDDASKFKLQQKIDFLEQFKKDRKSFISYLQVVQIK